MISNGELRMLLCAAAFSSVVGACMTMPDGSSKPDYMLVEFGAVAVFTVIVNETEVSDEVIAKAYEGLLAMEQGILAVKNGSGAMSLPMIDAMLASAVPMEYKALASAGSRLIRNRIQMYMDTKLPENPITRNEVTIDTTLAVVQGAKAALQSKYQSLQ